MMDSEQIDILAAAIEADDGDPNVVLPLLSVMSEAALAGAHAKLEGDSMMAAIHYGRVAGIMEAFAALGQPLPCESPSDAMYAAEKALTDEDGFAEMVAEARGMLDPDTQAMLDEYEEGEGHPQMDSPWDYEERDDTPYLTEDYDFHNEQAAGEDDALD